MAKTGENNIMDIQGQVIFGIMSILMVDFNIPLLGSTGGGRRRENWFEDLEKYKRWMVIYEKFPKY